MTRSFNVDCLFQYSVPPRWIFGRCAVSADWHCMPIDASIFARSLDPLDTSESQTRFRRRLPCNSLACVLCCASRRRLDKIWGGGRLWFDNTSSLKGGGDFANVAPGLAACAYADRPVCFSKIFRRRTGPRRGITPASTLAAPKRTWRWRTGGGTEWATAKALAVPAMADCLPRLPAIPWC